MSSSPRSIKPASCSSQADADAMHAISRRPFACPERGCGQRFKRRYTLKEHVKTHSGEKPFVCPVRACAKSFTTSGNLARHKRQHPWLKAQVCPLQGCARAFATEFKLQRHLRGHFDGSRRFRCVQRGCHKDFTTAGNLTRHVKQHHDHEEARQHSTSTVHTPSSEITSICSSSLDSPVGVESSSAVAFTVAFAWPVSPSPFDRSAGVADGIMSEADAELLDALACLFD